MKPTKTQSRQMLYVVTAFLLLLLLMLLRYHTAMEQSVKQRADTVLTQMGAHRTADIKSLIEEQQNVLAALAGHMEGPPGLTDADRRAIFKSIESISGLCKIGFSDTAGNVLFGGGSIKDISGYAFFRQSGAGERAAEYVPGTADGYCSGIVLSVPLKGEGGAAGVLFGSLRTEAFYPLLHSEAFYNAEFSMLCAQDGGIIAVGNEGGPFASGGNLFAIYAQARLDGTLTPEALSAAMLSGGSGTFSYTLGGESYYASYAPADSAGWVLVNILPADAAAAAYSFITRFTDTLVTELIILFSALLYYVLWTDRRKVNALKNEAELLRRSEEQYRLLEELSDNVLFEADFQNGSIFFNQNFNKLFGRAPLAEKILDIQELMPGVHPEDHETLQRLYELVITRAEKSAAELRILDSNGCALWCRVICMAQRDEKGKVYRVVGKIENIDSEKRELQSLRGRAAQDSLTKLYNRETAQSLINEYLDGAGLKGVHALFLLDLDGFKSINDTCGHMAGDHLLVALAQEMRKLFRTSDIIGRLGGDEFVIFLKEIGNIRLVEKKCDELCAAIRMVSGQYGHGESVTCSVGACLRREGDVLHFEDLYAMADSALYDAKSRGKNQYRIFGQKED